jgi:APA family basic amino acid/polyamine antiporter
MKAFNDLVGFVAGWAVMLDYTVDIALFSLATAGYASYFLPYLKEGEIAFEILGSSVHVRYLGLAALVLVVALIVVNIIGIRESSRLNEVLVSADISIEAIIILFGLVLAFDIGMFIQQIKIIGSPTQFASISYLPIDLSFQSQNFLYGITIAMTSFIGIESIAQAAEETRRPDRWVPRAHKLSILSVIIFAIGLSIVSMGIVPWQSLADAQTDPMTAIASAIPFIGSFLAPIVAITGFAICYVSTNTGIIGVSRIVFSMGRFKLLPRWFYKVHLKFRTPYRTILVFGSIGALLAAMGELHFVADLYNFGALLSYIIVNVCLIVLRNTEREAYRPWKIPGELDVYLRGRIFRIPLVSLVGTLTCSAIWVLLLSYHPAGRTLGIIWLVIGLLAFAVFRRKLRLSMFSRETGKKIRPGGYVMNALVLTRIPEDKDSIVRSLVESLDRRFMITLLNIIDPSEFGLMLDRVRHYAQLRSIEESSLAELASIAEALRKEGFDCDVRVEVGPTEPIMRSELESPRNDVVILVKRKTLKSDLEKHREDSIYAIASRYPGKLMIARRSE